MAITVNKFGPVLQAPSADELSAIYMSLGRNADEGLRLRIIDEVVDLDGAAAAYKALTTAIPANSVILSIQACIEEAVTVATSGGAFVGLGTHGTDPDVYGKSSALTKNSKITTLPDWSVISTSTTIDVCGIADSTGYPIASGNFTGGKVRVRIVYLSLAALASV